MKFLFKAGNIGMESNDFLNGVALCYKQNVIAL